LRKGFGCGSEARLRVCFEETSAIAAGDVCKGLGSLPTSGLRCDHLQALLAAVIKEPPHQLLMRGLFNYASIIKYRVAPE
jgi:hypothetical protein